MVAAVRVHKAGGPEVLTYEDVAIPAPGQGQIKIKTHAAGVNFIDCYFRNGSYPAPSMPFIAGNESAGEVIAVGPGVTDLKVGDRVAYVGPLGGYAAERVFNADRAVKLPDNITYEQAAGMMLKGMTAEYLLRRTFKVKKGDTILFHAAAGGVGLIAGQWAKHLGATTIGTAGSPDKVKLAKAHGFDHVINYREQDFVVEVKKHTNDRGVDVILDMVAGDYVPRELESLAEDGRLVFIATLGGKAADIDASVIMRRRLTLTGSTLRARSVAFKAALAKRLHERVWPLLASGQAKPVIFQVFPARDAAKAHALMESSEHIGKIMLTWPSS